MSLSILWWLGWKGTLDVNFIFTRPSKSLAVGQMWFYYHHNNLLKSQAKLHLPTAAKSHQPSPEGRSPSRLPRHKQTVLPSRTTDYWSLERNVQFLPPELGVHLIWAPEANPFSSLHLSFPVPRALQSLTWDNVEMQKCRKSQSRNAESHRADSMTKAKQMQSPQIFWRRLFIHSHSVSGVLEGWCWEALTVIKVQWLPTEYLL